jgi:hypothetical protein
VSAGLSMCPLAALPNVDVDAERLRSEHAKMRAALATIAEQSSDWSAQRLAALTLSKLSDGDAA